MQKYKRLFNEVSTFDAVEGVYQLLNSTEGLEWLAKTLGSEPDADELGYQLKDMDDTMIKYYYNKAEKDGLMSKVHNEFDNYVSMKGN